jgi:hypothetical protein
MSTDTTSPAGVKALRNLATDPQDAGCRARFLIHDRDGKYPALFDTILADTASRPSLAAFAYRG